MPFEMAIVLTAEFLTILTLTVSLSSDVQNEKGFFSPKTFLAIIAGFLFGMSFDVFFEQTYNE